MVKALIWLVIALLVIGAAYFAVLGIIKAVRTFLREDDLDTVKELRDATEALREETERAERFAANRPSRKGPRT